MQLSAFLFALLPAFAAAKECVASGSATQVDYSVKCCHGWSGKWCGTTDYQGICVIPDSRVSGYIACSNIWGNPTNAADDCIPGDGSELTSCTELYPTTTTTSARETITG